MPLWDDQLLPQLLMEQFDTVPFQCKHVEFMPEDTLNKKTISDIMKAMRTWQIFPNMAFVYA